MREEALLISCALGRQSRFGVGCRGCRKLSTQRRSEMGVSFLAFVGGFVRVSCVVVLETNHFGAAGISAAVEAVEAGNIPFSRTR